ncbi:phospho-N-acetylmuramoyl-pentapeptide-transferase [Candidatus Kuenenbacteria bacterium CG_4_9_14_3_um_filter_39_14]|uniref:Phospho-N-acetylmuramoyl-pentapeptide-transferase n=7 Tax=Candidatus Kueneniibacteriota TaxID=1752740 RepID=A0A2M7IM10_9BACT|nr:MAG: phospho-N-acetylmuramoyl-pentapeptide-transferase [Candidatus Kuenenbacteria bacterium CG2_30_39_24]PIP28748.1 MAG: phospho-N-acetylmuramoyl-pentapeptide-transferase [Candidatus Kuenenbacteria bacterium CG23_combo_of_CG06-09_8_20_14_all_39_39]PIP75271.1 MAG: phospho-N-acetylmuramoyl-pentapeptide-transferase [Candidatus Kuenenbacteria bacterium CG22_combo_CG10-13_8_21_14_all_39_9]PIR80913.1 MAG: phospho-N-acetylmuramoyl-pentapeptide-transferase [Candidatus Kuenenbacteria bacterium CG10_bi
MSNMLIIKILILTTLSFLAAFAFTPALTHFLYKHKLGKSIRNTGTTPIFSQLHAHKAGTPTMGGILIWLTTLILALIFFYFHLFFPHSYLGQLNFLTRAETFLPLGVLIAAALVGLIDDLIDIKSKGKGGIRVRHRLALYTAIAVVGALWFYFKLDWDVFHIPFIGNFSIGWWYIPIFIFIIVATSHSVNLSDGLDGLASGLLLSAFAAYGTIAFIQGHIELAAFCAVIIGATLAFLWFNITPARFYMGDTGAMALGVTLAVVAMLTNQALLLIVIGFLFVIESLSVILQQLSKKLRRGKKIFLSTPIHHHFEARGWSEPKIVMRFWVIAGVSAVAGIIIFLLDKGT